MVVNTGVFIGGIIFGLVFGFFIGFETCDRGWRKRP